MDQGHVPKKKDRERGPASTYANRIARMHYLMHHFPGGHPVLDIEKQLVQMAGSELKEFILKSNVADSPAMAAELTAKIRSIAEARVRSLVQDRGTREHVIESMAESCDLKEFLPGTA